MADPAPRLPDREARLLSEFLELLRVEGGLARNTIAAYRRDLTRLLDELARETREPLRTLDADALVRHLGRLRAAGAAESSVARALAATRSFLHFLVAEGELDRDPSARIETPRLPRTLPTVLDVDQVRRLLEAPQGEGWRAQRDRALLEVLYSSGARVSECVALSLDDLPPQLGELRLHGKGDKTRVVPLGRSAGRALRTWIDEGRERLKGAVARREVFLSNRSTPLTRQAAWRIVADHARRAGLPSGISPHTLRHSYASHLVEAGADLRSVQELLGHASVGTTQRYTHTDGERVLAVHRLYHPRG